MISVDAAKEGALFTVLVQPHAKRVGVRGEHAGALRIGVAAAPERGKANQAVAAVLSEALMVAASDLELHAGAAHRTKRFLVRGLDSAELRRRLANALAAAGAAEDA